MAIEQYIYVTKLDRKDAFLSDSKHDSDITSKQDFNISSTEDITTEREGSITSSEISIAARETTAWQPTRRINIIVATLALCLFVVALDSTILITALPTIAEALHANTTQTFWIATSYLLTSATFQPLTAALATTFGRRPAILTSVATFTIGTMICCVSQTFRQLLAGRAIQGIGGGGIITMYLMILSDLVPLRQRARYMGYVQVVFALGTVLGPVVGGVCARYAWRAIFVLNLPFCALSLVAVPYAIRYKAPVVTMTPMAKLASVDWIGATAFIVCLTAFLVGISWGGNEYPWGSAATLCPVLLGLFGLALTLVWEKKGPKNPFLKLELWCSRSAIAVYTCTLLQALLLYASTYYTAFYLLSVKLLPPTPTGLGMLSGSLIMVPTSALSGLLIARIGRFRWCIWAGWILTTASFALLSLLSPTTPTWAWILIFALGGFAQGLLFLSLSVAAQAAAPPGGKQAEAAAMYAFVRSLGLCVGVSVGGSVFQNFLTKRFVTVGLPAGLALQAEGFVAFVLKGMGDGPVRREIVGAFSEGFRGLFLVLLGVAVLGGFVSLAIKGEKLEGGLEGGEFVVEEEEEMGREGGKVEAVGAGAGDEHGVVVVLGQEGHGQAGLEMK